MKQQKGFAILETLVAFIVMAVGLLALISYNNAAMRSNADGKVKTQAINLAQAKLEELRSFYDEANFDAEMQPFTADAGNDGLGVYSAMASPADFSRSWAVDTSTNPAKVSVNVAWLDTENKPQNVYLTTNIYKEDILSSANNLQIALSGSGGGDGDWSSGDGNDGGTRTVEQEWTVDEWLEAGNTLPLDYTEDKVVLYKIIISGPIQVRGNIEVDGEVIEEEIPEVTGIIGENPDTYPASCDWISDPDAYTCQAFYLSTTDGWSGTIVYEAAKQSGEGAIFCLPVEAQFLQGSYERAFENVLYDQTVLVRVGNNITSCDL